MHTQQSNNYYAEKISINLMSLQLEFYRHDCRNSESSLVSLKTNILHNLFGDIVIFCLLWLRSVKPYEETSL